MLPNLDRERRDPAVVAQAVREHRTQWVMLYNAGLAADDLDESTTQAASLRCDRKNASETLLSVFAADRPS